MKCTNFNHPQIFAFKVRLNETYRSYPDFAAVSGPARGALAKHFVCIGQIDANAAVLTDPIDSGNSRQCIVVFAPRLEVVRADELTEGALSVATASFPEHGAGAVEVLLTGGQCDHRAQATVLTGVGRAWVSARITMGV